MKTLFLIRHGESEWNRAGLIQGQTDTPLTNTGIDQANAIRDYLCHHHCDLTIKIHCSPLERAVHTASIIAAGLNYKEEEILIDERLNDFKLGEISGIAGWEKVAEMYPDLAHLRLNNPLRFHPPGGESGTQFWNRLSNFLSQPSDDHITHIVVAHGVVNKFIRSIRRGITGANIIALGESQDAIYQLINNQETEVRISGQESNNAKDY